MPPFAGKLWICHEDEEDEEVALLETTDDEAEPGVSQSTTLMRTVNNTYEIADFPTLLLDTRPVTTEPRTYRDMLNGNRRELSLLLNARPDLREHILSHVVPRRKRQLTIVERTATSGKRVKYLDKDEEPISNRSERR